MSRLRPVSLLIILLCAGLLGWQIAHRKPVAPFLPAADPAPQGTSEPAKQPASRPPASLRPGTSEEAGDRQATSPLPSANVPSEPPIFPPVPATAESSTFPAETVLQNLRVSIKQYAATFGENPVGTNPEITSALQGQNPKQMSFLKADGNRVNSNGELVDIWGTPYFFHQLSAHEMEIRSAGPDRRMYTADDLVTR